MAYDTNEERLLVKGSERITRDLKVNRDVFVGGDLTVNNASLTTALTKLDGIQSGAEVNVQADWSQTDTSADDYIKNKPNIPPTVVPDSAMSDTSRNPVENKVIKQYVDEKNADYLYLDAPQNTHKKWINGRDIYRQTDTSNFYHRFTQVSGIGDAVIGSCSFNNKTYVITSYRELYSSSDGTTYSRVTLSSPLNSATKTCICATSSYMYIGTTNKGVFYTSDGSTFTQIPSYTTANITCMYNSYYSGLLIGTQTGDILLNNGNTTLVPQDYSSIGTAGAIKSICESIDNYVFVSVNGLGLIKSIDGRAPNYTLVSSTFTPNTMLLFNRKLYASDASHSYVSLDGYGNTFEQLYTAPTKLFFNSYDTLYALLETGFLFSSLDGINFAGNIDTSSYNVYAFFDNYNKLLCIGKNGDSSSTKGLFTSSGITINRAEFNFGNSGQSIVSVSLITEKGIAPMQYAYLGYSSWTAVFDSNVSSNLFPAFTPILMVEYTDAY